MHTNDRLIASTPWLDVACIIRIACLSLSLKTKISLTHSLILSLVIHHEIVSLSHLSLSLLLCLVTFAYTRLECDECMHSEYVCSEHVYSKKNEQPRALICIMSSRLIFSQTSHNMSGDMSRDVLQDFCNQRRQGHLEIMS